MMISATMKAMTMPEQDSDLPTKKEKEAMAMNPMNALTQILFAINSDDPELTDLVLVIIYPAFKASTILLMG